MAEFASRLRQIRLLSGFTQKEVYTAVGASERNYQSWEYGEVKPSYDGLLAIADFYEVSVDFFAGRGVYAHLEWLLANKERVALAVSPLNAGLTDLQYLQLVLPCIVEVGFVEHDGVKHTRILVREHRELLNFYDFESAERANTIS